jgi:hypothetical protein
MRWDATDDGWRSDMDCMDWWGLVAEPVAAAGITVTDSLVTAVWQRMNRTVRNRDVPTSAGLLIQCAGVAQCVDHIVPRHLLKALGDGSSVIEDFHEDVNLQASCLWCNEIKNRFEQLRSRRPAVQSHPGYTR